MEDKFFYPANYKGSKEYNQWDVPTANATGFGAAADDYAERGIDLNEQLIKNKPATFFMRVNSDAMIGAGIHHGDVVIVDRSLEPKNGKVIIAVLDGEMLIRKLEINEEKKDYYRLPKNYRPLKLMSHHLFLFGGSLLT